MAKQKTDPKHIKDLVPDENNARKHNQRNIGMIVDALHEVGAGRSIVIDENDKILAGNGTVEAAAEAGITNVRVIEADGNEIIAVRRSNLTEEQKQRLALFDNRAAELAEWNTDVLREMSASDGDSLAQLWTDKELDDLIGEEEAQRIEKIDIPRPTDVAYVFIALPLAVWPKHQAAVEAMQKDAEFAQMVMRPANWNPNKRSHGDGEG